jgi:hypothetical protein
MRDKKEQQIEQKALNGWTILTGLAALRTAVSSGILTEYDKDWGGTVIGRNDGRLPKVFVISGEFKCFICERRIPCFIRVMTQSKDATYGGNEVDIRSTNCFDGSAGSTCACSECNSSYETRVMYEYYNATGKNFLHYVHDTKKYIYCVIKIRTIRGSRMAFGETNLIPIDFIAHSIS